MSWRQAPLKAPGLVEHFASTLLSGRDLAEKTVKQPHRLESIFRFLFTAQYLHQLSVAFGTDIKDPVIGFDSLLLVGVVRPMFLVGLALNLLIGFQGHEKRRSLSL